MHYLPFGGGVHLDPGRRGFGAAESPKVTSLVALSHRLARTKVKAVVFICFVSSKYLT